MMWNGGMSSFGWLWMLFGALFMVALLVLVVVAVVWLTRGLGGSDQARATPSPDRAATGSARDALDLRYARGEISRDEYQQARRDLDTPIGESDDAR